MLFKLIGNVLDFERVTYVLSFDNDKVRNIFENQSSIDYNYLKKIIQMQIRVPEINRDVLNKLFMQCLNNIFLAYGETKEGLENYNSIIKCMSKQSIDIRDFKRFINSVFGIPFIQRNYLFKKDLLVIEYLKMFNLELYQQIYFNQEFFISDDKMHDTSIYISTFNKEAFNKKAQAFFDKLFSDENNYKYIEILGEVFPYVKKYRDSKEFLHGYEISDQDYYNVAKHAGVCSTKYFDLYFTYTKNDYVFALKKVRDFVDDIKQATDFDCRDSIFNSFINSVQFHQEFFEKFQLYLDDLQEDVSFDMVRILFDKIDRINNLTSFFILNTRARVTVIIWELLQKITSSHYDEFLTLISLEYGKIEIISRILYWFKNDREGKNIEGRAEKLKKIYEEMGNTISEKVINLYSDSYYFPKNIWGFYRIYKDDEKKIKDYFKNILCEKNIFRFMYDICDLSVGKDYEYSIKKAIIDLFTTEEEIDRISKKAKAISEDEQFILDVYKSYKRGITGDWGVAGVNTDEEKVLKL